MNLELVGALEELEKERGISKEILLEAIEAAIISAYKRNYNASAQNVDVHIDPKSGAVKVYAQKQVVEDVEEDTQEISLEEAREIDPSYQLGDIIEVEITPRNFGRIAAQTAKQVVIQRIREAERALIYQEYSNKIGDVVTGIVSRHENLNVMVELGKIEAVLSPRDQMPNDDYSQGTRLKLYIADVKEHTKGPQVIISRTHPMLLLRLFELEVPEIASGIVEIKAVAREAGVRSKIAVASNSETVDPVGACVGPKGVRVQAVVSELRGEKVDIIAYSDDPREFIANALSPARVSRVLLDGEEKSARVVVPDDQLSLAIGKEGQNARLAARLTGWRIDIKSEQQMAEIIAREAFALPESLEARESTSTDEEMQDELLAELGLETEAELETEQLEDVFEAEPEPEIEVAEEELAEVSVEDESGEPAEAAEDADTVSAIEQDESDKDDEIDYSGLDRIEAFKLRLSKARKAQEQQKRKPAKSESKAKASSEKKQESVVLHDLSALKQFFESQDGEE